MTIRMFLRAHWVIGAIVAGGVALRLAQYAAPSIVFLPDLRVEDTFTTFLLTNLFVVAATLALAGLGRELDGPHTGIVAAMLFTVSPLVVYYGRFHVQQAAAVAAMAGAALCATLWLRDTHDRPTRGRIAFALGSVVLGSAALALDTVNLHLLAALAIISAGRRRWWVVALLLVLTAALAVPVRAELVWTRDLWSPPIPAPGAIAISGVTFAILWDRLTVLLLPAGGFVLLALGMLHVRQRRDLIFASWVIAAVIVCVWVVNRHLVHGAAYVSLLAVLCLAAGRGASIVLAAGGSRLVRRNLATLAVATLVLSVAFGEGYALARVHGWNTAMVAERETIPLSWLDGLRAHGAWYFLSSAQSLDEIGDRTFADEMQSTYGSRTFNHELLFPILHAPGDMFQPPGGGHLPLVIEAEERTTHLGRVVFDRRADNGYAVRSNREGFVLQGPFLVYPEGEYIIDFRLRAVAQPAGSSVVGHVDVAQRRTVVARAPVDLGALPGSDYGHVLLTVTLPRAEVTEFRFFGYGTHTVWLDNIRIRPPASPAATH